MSARFRVRFSVPMEIVVELDADDENAAAEAAWPLAQERLQQVAVHQQGVAIFGDLDGTSEDSVEEVTR